MDVLQATSRRRETYSVRFTYSLLWESALGIAAVTNTRLLDTLEKSTDDWHKIKQSLPRDVLNHLTYVEKNNTWKALLQLLHEDHFKDVEQFCTYIRNLESTELKRICLPYVGQPHEALRKRAAGGDLEAKEQLMSMTSHNPFFPQYIAFMCMVDSAELKQHLIEVMNGWYEHVVKPELNQLTMILKTDYESKLKATDTMTAEELVQWATGGVTYTPEPSVHHVLLIPQYAYRPWNIEADIEGTKVFYYPVANESITPHDRYTPNQFLVLKHKALGDDVRLRIIKLLDEGDQTLQSLTDHLQIGKSTVHHHLKILRSAKLVEIIDSRYSLKKNVLQLLAKELAQYLRQ